ncbi:MAG: YfiR family protein [Candidatus Thiodiazotropha sp.]|nr:YfiR family protein [Candidatus Thiodiazotropha sp.]
MQLSILLLLTGISLPLYPATPSTEYKLKAALIYKLTKFIEWPEVQSDQSQSSFGICLLGEDLFGEALDELEERNVLEQSITVYRFSQSDAIDARCQIVFISKSKQAFVVPILQSLKDRPILTLSDMADFAKQGGMLQFTTGKKHVGFRINLESAKQSNFVIAAPLLDIATIISSKP